MLLRGTWPIEMGEENKKVGLPVKGRLRLAEVLRPHWVAMSLAAVAVVGETAADLAQPWPLKIVLDYVLPKNPKHMPGWLALSCIALPGRTISLS